MLEATRSLVIIAPLTTRVRHISAEVPLTTMDKLPQNCVFNLDKLTTISKSRLSSRLTALTPERSKEADTAIHFAMGLD